MSKEIRVSSTLGIFTIMTLLVYTVIEIRISSSRLLKSASSWNSIPC